MSRKYKTISIVIISVFINSFFLIQLLGSKINPIISKYVNLESERITSNVVDGAVNEILSKKLDDDLFTIKKNSNDEIQVIDYNTKKVNGLLKLISQKIQKDLTLLENGNIKNFMIADTVKGEKFKHISNGIVCELPIGALSGNAFTTNLGPNIPIKMTFLGQVNSSIKTKVTNYGINNLFVEISIHVEVKERITMPVSSKDRIVKVDAPLTTKIIQGKIPEYYGGNINSNSNMLKLPNN